MMKQITGSSTNVIKRLYWIENEFFYYMHGKISHDIFLLMLTTQNLKLSNSTKKQWITRRKGS